MTQNGKPPFSPSTLALFVELLSRATISPAQDDFKELSERIVVAKDELQTAIQETQK